MGSSALETPRTGPLNSFDTLRELRMRRAVPSLSSFPRVFPKSVVFRFRPGSLRDGIPL